MANLPSKEELVTLYNEKGLDALVWYAWRNALRALPLLGASPLHKVWEARTFQSVYAVCRVSMVLAQWIESPSPATFARHIRDAAYAAEYEARDAARGAIDGELAYDIAFSDAELTGGGARNADFAYEISYADADESAAGDNACTIAAFVAEAADNAAEAAFADNAAAAANAAAHAATAIARANAAAADCTLLLHKQGDINLAFWLTQPLWWGGESEQVRMWRHNLMLQLQELGLGFLADDLNMLWEGKPLGAHIKNYLQNLSETITNDPELLRRAILLDEDTENVHAVRVLLLGPGGAGKSSLADRLQGKAIEQIKRMTVGVDYQQHKPLNLHKNFTDFGLEDKKLDLYLWDFGGQTIFHGLHSAFLHENCVYVLVVDSRHEQAPDEWLHQIRHLAGSQAKVLLVTNEYEDCKIHQNETRLLREFPDLLQPDSFFYFSCLNKQSGDFKGFVNALVQASLDSQKMVLKETLQVQQALEEQYKVDIFLSESALRKLIIEKTNRPEYVGSTINQLQQLGFLVQVDDEEEDYCLKPAWAVDSSYELLYSPVLRDANGVLPLKSLQQAFSGKIERAHLKYLIGFLEERSVCRKLENNEYFFPDATKADEPPEIKNLLAEANQLTLRFDLPYLPMGFHARLVHRLFVPHNDVGIISTDDIWRQGFILRARDSQAVVQYSLRKSVIELTLIGNLKGFSELLREFYINLKAVVVNAANGIKVEQINPSVLGTVHN